MIANLLLLSLALTPLGDDKTSSSIHLEDHKSSFRFVKPSGSTHMHAPSPPPLSLKSMSPLSDSQIHSLLVKAKLPTKVVKHFACTSPFYKMQAKSLLGGFLDSQGAYFPFSPHPFCGLRYTSYVDINYVLPPYRGGDDNAYRANVPLFLVVYALEGGKGLPSGKGKVWGGETEPTSVQLGQKHPTLGTEIEVTSGGTAYFALAWDCRNYYDAVVESLAKSGEIYLHRVDIYQLER